MEEEGENVREGGGDRGMEGGRGVFLSVRSFSAAAPSLPPSLPAAGKRCVVIDVVFNPHTYKRGQKVGVT